jgi:hypothetical protein
VLVSVRHAVGGTDLGQLHEAVKREFLTLDESERNVRAAIAKIGIGGRVAPPPLPHHRTCGSASGGSAD